MNLKLSYCLVVFLCLFSYLQGQVESYKVKKTTFSTDKYAEFAPVFFSEGLIYTTDKDRGLFSYSGTGDVGFVNMYYVDTASGSKNSKPHLFSKDLSSKFNDGPPTFQSFNNTIYYSRNLFIEGNINMLSSPRNKLGIFSAIMEGEEWTRIRGFRFNSEWYNIITPYISQDGQKLYFASDMPDGYGGMDLYYCNWKGDYWDRPVNLGPVINSSGNESYPFENEAGEFFFSSDGHQGMGGKDIFYSQLSGNDWLKPVGLNASVNSEYDDLGFITGSLLSKGYFSSNREGTYDIYEFKTNNPQVFYINYQEENNYCFSFQDTGNNQIDLTLLKYVWCFGDGETDEGMNVKHCYKSPGNYELSFVLLDRNTVKVFFRKLDYILKVQNIEQAYIEAPDFAMAGENVQFSGLRSNLPGYKILDYYWDFGDGKGREGPQLTHKFSESGEYDVTLFLTMRSVSTQKLEKATVSKKFRVVSNQIEKQYLQAEVEKHEEVYTDFLQSKNSRVDSVFIAEEVKGQGGAFCIELLESKESVRSNNRVFRNLPDKYILKERYDPNENHYRYTVQLQEDLMALFPSWKEITSLGFSDAQAKLIRLKDPAEKELFRIMKNFDNNIDIYFDQSDRLTSNTYVLLDQIVKFLKKYPDIKLEIGVHTDNLGSATRKISQSSQRAEKLKVYLTSREIEAGRIIARGYGEVKPIAPNTYEANRRLNRRIEFRVVGVR